MKSHSAPPPSATKTDLRKEEIPPAPTTEREAALLAEKASESGVTLDARPQKRAREIVAPVAPADMHAPPALYSGPGASGVSHIPGTDIVVGGPTQQ